jgi:hypothetical protein
MTPQTTKLYLEHNRKLTAPYSSICGYTIFNTIFNYSVEEFLMDGFCQKAEKFLFATYDISILLYIIFMEIIDNRGK